MSEPCRYAVFETRLGWVGILASDRGLRATTLPLPTPDQARNALGPAGRDAGQDVAGLADVMGRLGDYLAGRRVVFPDSLELDAGTAFQRRVWEATRLIPYGETRSYQWVARQTGGPGAARAAGHALGRNPLPIVIPCHRVIAADGSLGGFSGGLSMKRRLLELEGAQTS